jgi:hypothetical protein
MSKVKEKDLTEVRDFVDGQFQGLFRDVYNIIEISFDHNREVGKKVKELVGKRIAIANEESIKSIDSLYPEEMGQTLPPVASRLPKEE